METLKIFIATHCDFECPVKHPAYELLDSRKMDGDRYGELSGSYFSELFNYQWAGSHLQLPDYVGFCGYRKYFSFMDNVRPEILIPAVQKFGCLCGQKLHFQETVRQQYAWNHNHSDMELLEEIVKKNDTEFYEFFRQFLEGHDMYTCNMFIMNRSNFIQMMKFIWNVLEQLPWKFDADVQKHVYDEFMKGHTRCIGGIKHQSRIAGYLGERLVSAYIMLNFPNAQPLGMVQTSERIRN